MSGLKLTKIIKKYDKTQVIHGVDLQIEPGEFCVFVGPSGCGKSTLLRMIAGLEEVSAGNIHIGTRDVTHIDSAERRIAMVFQTYALYPHMNVEENMGFGLKMNKVDKATITQKVADVASILKLEDYMARKPKALSGGQRQRVAIGRALVREPQIFLFDEPLSNLDAELRVEMRIEIARLHQQIGTTMIYVTHDQVEAMTLADKIVVLRAGNIEQVGSPMALYENPDNKFVAGFIGSPAMNFVNGTAKAGNLKIPTLGSGSYNINKTIDGAITVGIRPEHIKIDAKGKALTIEIIERLGGVTYIHAVVDNEKLIIEHKGDSNLKVGNKIGIQFDEKKLYLFDAKTEQRIR